MCAFYDERTPHRACSAFYALFFIRCDFLRSTPGGCFPQTSLSATTARDKAGGRFCGTFYRRPCATFYGGAGLGFVAPRKGCSPLTSAGSGPCTCPEPLFIVAQGLCSTYRPAVKTFHLPNQFSRYTLFFSISSARSKLVTTRSGAAAPARNCAYTSCATSRRSVTIHVQRGSVRLIVFST